MSNTSVQVAAFAITLSSRAKKLTAGPRTRTKISKRYIPGRINCANKVENQSSGCYYHIYPITFQPDHTFSAAAKWNNGGIHREMRHRKMAFCQDTDYFPSHSVKVHSKCSIPLSTEWGHLVEGVGCSTSSISCWERRGWWRQICPTFRISLLVWKIACPMSSVILTDIIQTVLETSVFSIQ